MDANAAPGARAVAAEASTSSPPAGVLIAAVQALSLARDLGAVMRVVRSAARALTGADGVSFVLREGDVCYYADEEAIGPLWKGRRFPASACVSGWAMKNRVAVAIEDISCDPRVPIEAYRSTFVKSLAMMPIRSVAPIGAIGVYWARRHVPRPDELDALQALADSAALAMENVELYALFARAPAERVGALLRIRSWVANAVAVGATLAVAVLWLALPATFGGPVPFSALLLVVGVAGALGGRRPALLATTLSSLAAVYLAPLRGALTIIEPPVIAQLVAFAVSGVAVAFASEVLRRAVERGHADCVALATAYADLARTARTESERLEELASARTAQLAQAEQRQAALLVSERAARAEAERVSRIKDEMVAIMSHELRTPLNAIVGWTDLLARPGVSADRVARGLAVIARNTRALTQILSDMLDMSRIIAGKLHIDLERTELSAIVRGALDSFADAARSKRIDVRCALQDVALMADPVRLSQVVWNLVSNALKFTPEGGAVEVSTRVGDGRVILRVADTGPGIDPAFLPEVFDRFRQADASPARKHGGLGLGLSVVKHLVELHGGSVCAANRADGTGAVLTVVLPTAERTEEPRREKATAGDLRGLRVLVVDDDDDAREVAACVLGDHGATVTVASSASAALSMLAERGADVLVSDIGMPEVDGYELLRRLRATERAAGAAPLPAIALTAYARPEDRAAVSAAGYSAHVAKPLEALTLLAAVEAAAGGGARAAVRG